MRSIFERVTSERKCNGQNGNIIGVQDHDRNEPQFWLSGRIERNCCIGFRAPGMRHHTGPPRGHRPLTIDPAKRTVQTDRGGPSG